MAIWGRESKRQRQQAERVRDWVHARSPYALLSLCAGALTVVDSPIMVLVIPFGLAAIVLAVVGLRDITRHPERLGRRLCYAGIVLALLGWTSALLIWQLVYTRGS